MKTIPPVLPPTTAGVYLLTHDVTGDTYVGSARNMRIRYRSHSTGAAANLKMRRLTESHGFQFTFQVLEETEPSQRQIRESHWISELMPTLNKQKRTSCKPVKDRPESNPQTYRLPIPLLERLDTFIDAFEEKHGFRFTSVDFVIKALTESLDRREPEVGITPAKPANAKAGKRPDR